MSAPSVDIKDMIEGQSSLALAYATDLFIGKEPAAPDNAVTIYDTPGFSPDLTMNRTEKYQRPSIQIRVRNQVYTDGWDLINDVRDFLHGKSHETWNSSVYQLIVSAGDLAFLSFDNSNRALFVANFDIQRVPA